MSEIGHDKATTDLIIVNANTDRKKEQMGATSLATTRSGLNGALRSHCIVRALKILFSTKIIIIIGGGVSETKLRRTRSL